MISFKKSFLFIHVPKTGGNSIQNILKDYSEDKIVSLTDYQDGVERFEVRNEKYNFVKHSTLKDYKAQIDPEKFESLFKFSTIRNPWDRMISFYFSPHRGVREWNRDEFLTLLQTTPVLNHYIGLDASPESSENLGKKVSFLMRFENLEEDFKTVCKAIDIPFSKLPKRNQSNRNRYPDYYDEELKEAVRKKFATEITYGDYEF